jgi:hypothetical protein
MKIYQYSILSLIILLISSCGREETLLPEVEISEKEGFDI